MPLNHAEEVLTTKHLKAAAPLDRKIKFATIATRNALPLSDRYPMMKVSVDETELSYRLDKNDLTDTGWIVINEVDNTYDDTAIQAEVDLNTAKLTNVDHPIVETAVPVGAVFTDTIYDDADVLKDGDTLTPVTPNNKILTEADGGGGGDVSSVFLRTGAVVATNGDYNTSQVTENTNLYYTEARVSANTDVAANTAAKHSHTNKALLDTLTDAGVATNFLDATGNYSEPVSGGTPSGTVEGAIQFRNAAGDAFDADSLLSYNKSTKQFGAGDLLIANSILYVRDSVGIGQFTTFASYFSFNGALYLRPATALNGHLMIDFASATLMTIKPSENDVGIDIKGTGTGIVNFSQTNAIKVPVGTEAQRPTDVQGMFRFNTTEGSFEGYDGIKLGAIGGGTKFIVQQIAHSVEGALAIDFANGVYAKVALTANATSISITNPIDGKYTIELVQDAIGGRVVSFTGMYSVDGAIIDYSTNANASSKVELTIADGKTIIEGIGNLTAIA